ncbi:mandelate racemase/muconate lactonizing enzyme family protein [Shimia biformata]|uniref:mandelate racemase/muconate lactonizing enzyme family protein n=1 Tax=Shimia biformata TaxID=1294299 RepID=UPI00194ED305|nr:mandelate racemase/muconate lactonizing enzyme family protein [Shimia biformata]
MTDQAHATPDATIASAPARLVREGALIAAIVPFKVKVGNRTQLLVKVTTEDGLEGWGESGLTSREDAVIGALGAFSEFLIGQDSRRIGRLWQECYRSQYFEGGRVLTAAISAIDIALYDLLGKRLGVPVHQLLGGAQRDRVGSFATSTARKTDEVIAEVKELIAAGWDCVRIAPDYDDGDVVHDARASIAPTVEKLGAVRAAIGPSVGLGIDYHHRLSLAEAARFCNLLPEATLDFLEEPIRCETPESYAALRRMTNVPFAVGEEFASKWQAGPFIEQGLTQFMRVDICNIGGFTEAMKVAGWSERHYIDLMPHNPLGPICTAATTHMCAAVPNFAWVETRLDPINTKGLQDTTMFPVQVRMDGPFYIVSDAPGLGIEVDEAALKAAGVADQQEVPHLRHPDGSVTNW